MMKISELANRTGTTTKTLRFYEDAGVLLAPERAANGYRNYGDDTVTRVRFVKAGQAIGLTLAEIRDLQTMKRDLTQLRDRSRDLDPADCTPESVCHVINPGPCTCQEHDHRSRAAN